MSVITSFYSPQRYKAMFLTIVGVATVLLIMSAWSIRNDPRFMAQSALSAIKHVYYVSTFHLTNALGTATVYNSTATARALAGEPARSVPVLVYHGIINEPDGSTINITTEQFKEQLFSLKRAGYHTLTLNELYEYGVTGTPLPIAPIVITFDDGRSDSYYNGDPILDAVDFTASMYVITDYAKDAKPGGYYLSPAELKLMAKTGRWEIGSHSAAGHNDYPVDDVGGTGHYYSHNLWISNEARQETSDEYKARILSDFERSQQYLETLFDHPIRTFAFPFGDFGQNEPDAPTRTKEVTHIAGQVYDLLFYQHEPGAYFSHYTRQEQGTAPLVVRRINIDTSWDAQTLLKILASGDHKPLPYTDELTNDNGWINVWGEHVIKDGSLYLAAESESTGASTILDGTALWKNYEVRLTATSPNRTGFFLWTRFQNDNNNAGCNFGTSFVHAEQMLHGEKRVLTGVQLPPGNIPAGQFTATASIEGRTLICSLNGTEIVRTEFLDPALDQGGVGIKIWDATLGKSSLQVEQFVVEESGTLTDASASKAANIAIR